MKQETLEQAKTLSDQINWLEEEIKCFDEKHNCCHLQVQDQFGNKGHIIKLYAYKDIGLTAIGDTDDILRSEYKSFLKKSTMAIQKRIDELKKQLEKL